MISPRTLFLLCTLLVPALAVFDPEDSYCCMCEMCMPRARGDYVLNTSDGTTCDMLSLQMSDPTSKYTPRGTECNAQVSAYRQTCCDASYTPPEVDYVAPDPEDELFNRPQSTSKGTHPECKLCIDGSYPKKWNSLLAVLNVGEGSCKDFYYRGIDGHLSNKICYPLQDYAVDACGCPPTVPGSYISASAPKAAPAPVAAVPAAIAYRVPATASSSIYYRQDTPSNSGAEDSVTQRKSSPTVSKEDLRLEGGDRRDTSNRKLRGE